jgi:small subunit ribosomal protein S20
LANIKSAIKRIRSSERRRVRNRTVRSSTRTLLKKARVSINSVSPSEETVQKALIALDRAASKGIIHKNNAARRKSRLMKQYNRVLAAHS